MNKKVYSYMENANQIKNLDSFEELRKNIEAELSTSALVIKQAQENHNQTIKKLEKEWAEKRKELVIPVGNIDALIDELEEYVSKKTEEIKDFNYYSNNPASSSERLSKIKVEIEVVQSIIEKIRGLVPLISPTRGIV